MIHWTHELMSTRRYTRQEHLDQFAHVVEAGAWLSLKERRLFLVLWELPKPCQLALPAALILESVPRFESKHPGITFLRDLLARATSGSPPHMNEVADMRPALDAIEPDQADVHLYFAVSHICEGSALGAAPETITSAAIAATAAAVAAIATQAWIDDDPEAAVAERQFEEWLETRASPCEPCPVKLRPMAHNAAALDAEDAAWDATVAWLRAKDLGRYPEVADRSYLARCILRSYHDYFRILYPGETYRAPPTRALLKHW